MEPDYVEKREVEMLRKMHEKEHEKIDTMVEKTATAVTTALNAALVDHHREHAVHEAAHEREHQATQNALDKAEASMDKRLEGMNEFRAQLTSQSNTFLTREQFDMYKSEQLEKLETAFAAANDKYDTIMKAFASRHDADYNSLRDSIQIEREARKGSEGSMNTWKWIASFLGASGVAGVILLFVTRAGA